MEGAIGLGFKDSIYIWATCCLAGPRQLRYLSPSLLLCKVETTVLPVTRLVQRHETMHLQDENRD
jgi:hypothetical protein